MTRNSAVAVAIALLLCGDSKPVRGEEGRDDEGGLFGTYAFTTIRHCVNINPLQTNPQGGFEDRNPLGLQDLSFLPAPLDADGDNATSRFHLSSAINGNITFERNGHFHGVNQGSSINLQTLPTTTLPRTPQSDVVANFTGTYQVSADGFIGLVFDPVIFWYISGPRTATCGESNKCGRATGITRTLRIVSDWLLLTWSGVKTVENVFFVGVPFNPASRVCHVSGTYHRLSSRHGDWD